MKLLEERILRDAVVKAGGVLKVDSFLNHQIDIPLVWELAREWKRRFADVPVSKILTVEASGVPLATIVASEFGVPLVFAKKTKSINLSGTVYVAEVKSYTLDKPSQVIVEKRFISPDDHVLLIDDLLSNGCAINGLLQICERAGAQVEGIGIAIEKGFQPGGEELRARGYRVESLAVVDEMNPDTGDITFRE
ncbi:MAG: xanthine phosphoribosyltransferase [Coriobacteriia bacterium]|nr:xanthine phosphoribosyltransferase [Coriobacteriia bacterium]